MKEENKMSSELKITDMLKGVAEATSTEKYRKNLQKVIIKNKKAYATDGYMLAGFEVDCVDALIPSELIKKPKQQKMFDITVEINEEDLTVNEITHKTVMSKPVQEEFESYPNVEKILEESNKNDYYTFALSTDVLEKVVKVLKKSKQNSVVIKLQKNPMKPIYMKTGMDLELVVMPFKVHD